MLCSESSGLGDHFVTLFYALFDPATGWLAYASAGHEAVIIKRGAGGTDWLNATGPILGIADHAYEQKAVHLAVGDSLLLYTDGLTEARVATSREMLDLDRVAEIVRNAPPQAGPGALCVQLEQAALSWTGGRPQDDMALLVARRLSMEQQEGNQGEEPHTSLHFRRAMLWEQAGVKPETDGDALFNFNFPSLADLAAEVRQAIGHWMLTLGFDRDMTEDFQTAVTEAVTNAVKHGSPEGASDDFRVTGRRLPDGSLHVAVIDSGPGLIAGAYPAMPAPDALGGRGLPLMRALANSVEFLVANSRHSVVLTKRRLERPRK